MTTGKARHDSRTRRAVLLAWLSLFAFVLPISALNAANSGDETSFSARVDAPEADVLAAVHEVAADQIIHGTFSYEKEKILYGAHAADSSSAFHDLPAARNVFYKVAERVLAPRYFRESGDIGTITVRYAVQAAGPAASIVEIKAVFIDARHNAHASQGAVEAAEYAAIKEHVQAIALKKQQAEEQAQELARRPQKPEEKKQSPPTPQPAPALSSVAPADSAKELEAQIEQLRRQVVVRVKDAATPLKSAPFKSASNMQLLAARSEVVVLILSPYWYGVETENGKRGWIQRSQVEPLP